MNVPLTAFHSLMRPHVPAAPRPILDNCLRLSAADWCARTRAWRYTAKVEITTQSEAIVAPGHAAIHEIRQAWFDGHKLDPVQHDELTPADLEHAGRPKWISQVTPGTVVLAPFEEGTLTVRLFLKPKTGAAALYGTVPADPMANAADEVPAFLLEQDAEPIVAGALARAMEMPGQEWTNPNLATYHRSLFNSAASDAFDRFMRGQQRAPVRVPMRFM